MPRLLLGRLTDGEHRSARTAQRGAHGLEDTALLDAASARFGRDRAESLAVQVSKGMTDFTRDPNVLRAARRELLEALDGP